MSTHYDLAFVGGGLAASLLLHELRERLPGRVVIIDPHPPDARPAIHLSYWSATPSFLDRLAIGSWTRARVAGNPPEALTPLTMRLIRSTDVFAHCNALVGRMPVEWLRATASAITRQADGRYAVATDLGVVRADWVFDSACAIEPTFPARGRPQACASGTGLRVHADRPVFDPATAILCDPLGAGGFAYVLPLSPTEALVESTRFSARAQGPDQAPLLRYLRARHPGVAYTIAHTESGAIPLGFAPTRTAGPRHILLGTKRGLIKPSAGFGVMRMVSESRQLAAESVRRAGGGGPAAGARAARSGATTPGEGRGMGGGGGASGRPVAAIVIGPDGVTVRPIFDATTIALVGITALGTLLALLLRMRAKAR